MWTRAVTSCGVAIHIGSPGVEIKQRQEQQVREMTQDVVLQKSRSLHDKPSI